MSEPMTQPNEAEHRETVTEPSSGLSPAQVIAGLAVGMLGIAFAAGGFDNLLDRNSVRIFNCELHTIQQCKKATYPNYDCLFTNNSGVVVDPNRLKVWYYDANNVQLDRVSLSHGQVSPGQTAHVQFLQENSKEATTATICSVDPQSALGQELPRASIQE